VNLRSVVQKDLRVKTASPPLSSDFGETSRPSPQRGEGEDSFYAVFFFGSSGIFWGKSIG
jgi:hypothetical protein